MVVDVLLAGTDWQFIGSAGFQSLRFVRIGNRPLRLLVVLVDAARSEAGESAIGIVHQAGEGVTREEGQAIGEAFFNLDLGALVVGRSKTFKVVEDVQIGRAS